MYWFRFLGLRVGGFRVFRMFKGRVLGFEGLRRRMFRDKGLGRLG